MKCQSMFPGENKKNISKSRLLRFLLSMQNIKEFIPYETEIDNNGKGSATLPREVILTWKCLPSCCGLLLTLVLLNKLRCHTHL